MSMVSATPIGVAEVRTQLTLRAPRNHSQDQSLNSMCLSKTMLPLSFFTML